MAVARDLELSRTTSSALSAMAPCRPGMAYEAMNNAGAMDSALSSFSTTTICRSRRPSVRCRLILPAVSSPAYRSLRKAGVNFAEQLPKYLRASVEPISRSLRAVSGPRHAVRGTRHSSMSGPIDGHHLRPSFASAARMCATPQWTVPRSCRHSEGQGLRAGGSIGRQIPWRGEFDVATGTQAKGIVRSSLHTPGFRREPRQGGAQG